MEQCSWNNMEPATMHFCERLVCDSFLIQPANAISNIAFVLVGLYLFTLVDRKSIHILFPISAVLVGITSFLYHASWTFFFQVFDVSSMFMLSCLLLTFNLWRLNILSKRNIYIFYPLAVIFSALLMIFIKGKSGEYIFGTEVTLLLLLEAYIYKKKNENAKYKNFIYAFSIFALSYGIWLLDVHEIVCYKDNHIFQGHALWHILNSFCFYFLYKFYLQFTEIQKK